MYREFAFRTYAFERRTSIRPRLILIGILSLAAHVIILPYVPWPLWR
jgi:hypothetical protein